MGKGIKLSPKYGVNPTLGVCFFCGEETGVVAMLGRIGDGRKHEDFEAPKRMVLDYEPCKKCREKFATGVLVMAVTDTPPDNRPPIQDGYYPTGAYVVVKPSALDGNFKEGSNALMMDYEFNEVFKEAL